MPINYFNIYLTILQLQHLLLKNVFLQYISTFSINKQTVWVPEFQKGLEINTDSLSACLQIFKKKMFPWVSLVFMEKAELN